MRAEPTDGTAASVTGTDLTTVNTASPFATVDLIYNDGGRTARRMRRPPRSPRTTRNGSSGNYDMTNSSDRSGLINAISNSLQGSTGGKVKAELVQGSAAGIYRLKFATTGTGTTAALTVGVGGSLAAGTAGSGTGSSAGSIPPT